MPHRLAKSALTALLGICIAPVRAADDPQTASTAELVQFESDRHDRLTVPVRIGENGPFDFLIDTGSERTVLSRQVAATLGLVVTGNSVIVGVAGSQAVELVDVAELSLGRRTFYGLSAPLLEGRHIGADGIVGLDSLQGQRVLLDFGRNRMIVDEARKRTGLSGFDIVVKARRKSGQLIMTNALVDGVTTDIVIDTGSDGSIGNPALQRALARRNQGKTTTLYSVTGQMVSADLIVTRMIDIDGLRLHNTVVAFADSPAFQRLGLASRPALLMGMSQLRLFSRVAIDFSARRIMFDMPGSIVVWDKDGLPF